jgi:hypothetical protein
MREDVLDEVEDGDAVRQASGERRSDALADGHLVPGEFSHSALPTPVTGSVARLGRERPACYTKVSLQT